MLLRKKKLSPYKQEQQRFSREYALLTEQLTQIRTNFDQVTDSDAIDAIIYEENAVLSRLSQLYKDAKSAGITLDIHEYSQHKDT